MAATSPGIPGQRQLWARSAGTALYPHLWQGLEYAYAPYILWVPDGFINWKAEPLKAATNGSSGSAAPVQERFGMASDYTGTTQWIENTGLTNYNFGAGGTVLWSMKPDLAYNDGTTHGFWGQTTGTGVPEFSAQKFSDDNFYIGWNHASDDDRVTVAASASNYKTDEWNDYAFVWYNGGASHLYHDGVLIASNSGPTSSSNVGTAFRIARQGAVSAYFDGTIDYFHMYSRPLSEAEIAHVAKDPPAMFRRRDHTEFTAFSLITDELVPNALVTQKRCITLYDAALFTANGATFTSSSAQIPSSHRAQVEINVLTNSGTVTTPTVLTAEASFNNSTWFKIGRRMVGSPTTGVRKSWIIKVPDGTTHVRVKGVLATTGSIAPQVVNAYVCEFRDRK